MDPLANLAAQRRLAERIQHLSDREDYPERLGEVAAEAENLAELVLALDEWRKKGGFDPYLYQQKPVER